MNMAPQAADAAANTVGNAALTRINCLVGRSQPGDDLAGASLESHRRWERHTLHQEEHRLRTAITTAQDTDCALIIRTAAVTRPLTPPPAPPSAPSTTPRALGPHPRRAPPPRPQPRLRSGWSSSRLRLTGAFRNVIYRPVC